MTARLALLMVLGVLAACDAPPQAAAPVAPPPPQARPNLLSAKEIQERDKACERKASEKFRREPGGHSEAGFAHHYNATLDACFYLLTVTRQEVLDRKLVDIAANETYGEFLGKADGAPDTCRVESMYCASGREWNVLVEPYMQN